MPSTNSKPSKQASSKTATNTGVAKGVNATKAQTKSLAPPPNASSLKESTPDSVTTAVQEFIKTTNQLHAINRENPIDNVAIGVNKKKQKRRQKQAARLAAENSSSQSNPSREFVSSSDVAYTDQDVQREMSEARARVEANGYEFPLSDYEDPEQYEPVEGEDLYFTDDDGRLYHSQDPSDLPGTNGHDNKAKKKKKSKAPLLSQHGRSPNHNATNTAPSQSQHAQPPPPPPPPPPLSTAAFRSTHHISKDRIWNTSTAEERERIKEFWLSLGEEERRSLVKVEKEAVLKKMKEQQKHSCSCTVCGRKRTAIEEELEVLYDAYYEELEQYANNQHISLDDGTPMMPHPRMYAHPMARIPPSRNPQVLNNQRLSTGRVQEVDEDDEEGDDEDYSDEDEEDELSEEEPEEIPPGPAADFFNFGNSLTVQGGILTVADDLLKNDGKKFIEMMEQLAERRMQREEEAQYAAAGLGHASMQPHNHGPSLDEEEYDEEEDDEEYDSQEDEDYDDDEMETLTEEQRMEEGRRMFQIFAARMFEQRVLTAYREKVANERQQKLIEELEEESRLDTQREAKRAKEAQKKKDKKRQQKQVKDEEKAKREAEKAAEEAAAKALEEKRAEEQRQKKEEQRKKREAEKKAQDEERQRKEAEKQRRLQEAREQQAELERKQREQKEREKKKRDESKKKERDEREAKEKEAREKKERDAAEKTEREAKARAAQEVKERSRKEEQAAKLAQGPPTSPLKQHIMLSAGPVSSGFNHPQTASNHVSPHLQIATPVVPKAPTPNRPRPASFQGSHNSSPKTSQPPSGGSTTSPSLPSVPQNGTLPMPGRAIHPAPIQPPQSTNNFSPISASPSTVSQLPPGFSGMPAMVGNNFSPSQGSMLPPMMQRAQMHEPLGHTPHPHHVQFNSNQFRNFMGPNGLPVSPGVNGIRGLSHGRGSIMDTPIVSQASTIPVSAANIGPYSPRDPMPVHSHSRNTSATFSNFDVPSTPTQTQPIARPTPIHRPSSVAPNQQSGNNPTTTNSDMDDLSNHLGSSALLEDTDIPLTSNKNESRHGSMAPGAPLFSRNSYGLGLSPMAPDATNSTKGEPFPRPLPGPAGSTWNAPAMQFGPPMSSPPKWPAVPGNGWSGSNHFGIIGGPPTRPAPSRAWSIRLLACKAYTKLQNTPPVGGRKGFQSAKTVLREVELTKPKNEGPITLEELLSICDMEGNAQNGGGAFKYEIHEPNEWWMKYDLVKFDGRKVSLSTRGLSGDIGSSASASFVSPIGATRASQLSGGVMSPSGF